MIRQLFRALGPAGSAPVTRLLAAMIVTALLQAAAFLALVPLLRSMTTSGPNVAALVVFLVLGSCWLVLTVLVQRRGFTTGAGIALVLHRRIADALDRLPRSWFTRGRAAEVSQLVGSTALAAMNIPAHFLRPLVDAVLVPGVLVLGMLVFEPRAGIAMLLCVPVLVFVLVFADRTVERADAGRHRIMDRAAERLLEFVRAQPALRSAGRSTDANDRLDEALVDVQRADRRLIGRTVPGVIVYDLVTRLAYVLAVSVTATALGGGAAEPWQLVSVIVLGARLSDAVATAAGLTAGMRMTRQGLVAMNEIVLAEGQDWPSDGPVPDGTEIVLRDVSASHAGTRVLHDVSLTIPATGLTAIVGPSGAGKSTLLALVSRALDVDEGTVTIGGVDVRRLTRDELTSCIAVANQDVFLVDGTVRENITLGAPDASPAEIGRIIRLAGIEATVAALPNGLDTPVGDRGDRFSGGEKQRIALARALATGAPVLLLDEIGSALDAIRHRVVTDALSRLARDRAVVVVAHRLSGVVDADTIIVLDEGRIVQTGTHASLVNEPGVYRRLWEARRVTGPGSR